MSYCLEDLIQLNDIDCANRERLVFLLKTNNQFLFVRDE
jgi:hypothetical protein